MRLSPLPLCLALAACAPGEPADAPAAAEASPSPASFEPYVERRENGLQVEVLAPGAGPAVHAGSRVTLHFSAHVPGAAQPFDTTRESGIPIELDLGAQAGPKPLAGLALGLLGLKRGAKAKLTIPPALAWGEAGHPAGGVPAASDVLYSIEIVEVR